MRHTDNPLTPRVVRVLRLADEQANSLNHEYVGIEHIMLALIQEQEGLHQEVWLALGIDTHAMEAQIRSRLAPGIQRVKAAKTEAVS